MSAKHRKTLEAIFADPVRANVRWADIESLIRHHGGDILEGSGSRVRVLLNGCEAVFHRPHPEPDTDKGALKSMRKYLERAGVRL